MLSGIIPFLGDYFWDVELIRYIAILNAISAAIASWAAFKTYNEKIIRLMVRNICPVFAEAVSATDD